MLKESQLGAFLLVPINAEQLPDDPLQLKAICLELMHDVDRLQEMLRLIRHQRFSSKSEMMNHPGMRSLFPDLEPESVEQAAETGAEGAERAPNDSEGQRKPRKTPNRKPLPEHLPRREELIDLKAEDKKCCECGKADCLKKVSEKVSEKLNIVPAKFEVIRYIRPVYSCKNCETMRNQSMPAHIFPKSNLTPQSIAHILVSKFADGLPFYRQEKIYLRQHIELSREHMSKLAVRVGDKLSDLIALLDSDLLEDDHLQIDETYFQVLKEDGRQASSKSFMIVKAREGPPGKSAVLFHYNPSRSVDVIKQVLGDFKGHLLADGLGVYLSFCANNGVTLLGCWQHARRKFTDAQKGIPPSKRKSSLATQGIEWIDQLFKIERGIKYSSKEERLAKRQAESKPIVDKIDAWLKLNLGKVPRKSLIGKALHYLNNQWPQLIGFLNFAALPISNNFVENLIRPFAVGRRAWLFSDTVDGAHASARIYSLLITAKINNLNPFDYMVNLLEKLPLASTEAELRALLPYNLTLN